MPLFQSSIESLRITFNNGLTRSYQWRMSQLSQLNNLIQDNKNEIHQALKADLGKCEFESIVAETSVIETDISYMKKHLKRWMQPQKVSSPMLTWPAKSYLQSEPLGVVLILGAWNYPFNLLIRPLVGAIAAGNCAVIKPSEISSHTSALMARLIPKYLDPSAFLCIEGDGDIANDLLQCRFDHIFYTGNGLIGRKVMMAASQHLTPVTLELGGKSPCLVDKSADISLTARRIAWSKWFNAGQTCIAPDYVLVDKAVAPALLAALKAEIVSFYGDDASRSDSYGRIVSQRHLKRLCSLLEQQPVAVGGQYNDSDNYLAPTVVVDPDVDSPLMREEIFGPILPVLVIDDHHQMIAFVNNRDKPLALYCYGKDKQFQTETVAQISAGNVCINDGMLFMANQNLPFGGVGPSGVGRYGGKFGFDTFSHQKSIMKRYFAFDVPLRYPPFTAQKAQWMKRIRWFG